MSTSVMQACVNIDLPPSDLKDLVAKAKDWLIFHGGSMRSKENFSESQARIAPFLLIPSSYPRKEFQRAQEVQTLLQELMHKVAHNYEFLNDTLKNTIEVDHFTSKLFNIYRTVYAEGFSQSISIGLIRSDYMLHSSESNRIKQVEINMISTSFGGLAVVTTDYHKYILSEIGHMDKLENIPENDAASGFSRGLIEAWKMYNNKKSVILFAVEDIVYNIFDQRAIEFEIRRLNPDTKVIRRTLTDLVTKAQLGPNKELLVDGFEIAVVYYRTGYQLEAYPSEREWDVRLLIERSRAIKCPSIHYHLAGTKKVQQQLAVPGITEKFISDPIKVAKIKEIFMGLYSLDLNEQGNKAVTMALEDPSKYVLKPQREGGGNNIYGDEIKVQLELMKDSKDRTAWILMERIYPPSQKNYLIRDIDQDLEKIECISELGIYGVLLGDENEIMVNYRCGHILRTKPLSANEGGIVSGAGALDGIFVQAEDEHEGRSDFRNMNNNNEK